MRPQRFFIIPRITPLQSFIVAVKFISKTVCHSSSDIRMNKLSRVIPALFTKISIPPIFSEASLKRSSMAKGLLKLHGKICVLSSNKSDKTCKLSNRVPLIATSAPASLSVLAISPPIPPDAPVTRAFFPLRSNIK